MKSNVREAQRLPRKELVLFATLLATLVFSARLSGAVKLVEAAL